MSDRPSEFPEWASDPPSAPPTTITEPSTPTKEAGFQPGRPRREYVNWLFNLIYQWLLWLAQSVFKFNDFGPDQPIPGQGTAPVTGSGFSVSAASFSASVYVNGYRVGPISAPAYVYTASQDHYWDLGQDGEWHVSLVANLASAPAVVANATRVYMVRTNGSNRTLVTDFRPSALHVTQAFDVDQLSLGAQNIDTAGHSAEARLVEHYNDTLTGKYTFLRDLSPAAGGYGIREYLRHASGQVCIVGGAAYDGTQWVADTTSSTMFLKELGAKGKTITKFSPGATVAFADSLWFTSVTSTNPVKLGYGGTTDAGIDLANNDYETSEVPRFRGAKGNGTTRSRQLELGHDGSNGAFQVYALDDDDVGTSNADFGGELCSNCHYSKTSALWFRIDSSANSYKIDIASNGVSIFEHLSSESSSWTDDVSSGKWTLIFSAADGSVAVPNVVQAKKLVPTSSGTSTPDANTLYKDNIVKAWGAFNTDGVGGFTSSAGFGMSAAISGSHIVVTLNQAFSALANFGVSATINAADGVYSRIANCVKISTTVFHLYVYDTSGAALVNLGTTANIALSFVATGNQ